MKLLEIVTMMDIIEHQQVWPISFLIKKTGINNSIGNKSKGTTSWRIA